MRYIIAATAFALVAGIALVSEIEAAPPANDDFPGTVITSLPFTNTVNTAEVTDQPGEPLCGPNQGLAVWYSFTPPADTILLADLTGSDYGVFVSAYTGSTLADLTCVADGVFFLSPDALSQPAVFEATGGITYYFQAGSQSFPPETGRLTFNLRQGEPPPNDDFPGTTITTLPFTDTVDTTFATFEPDEFSVIGPTVWYNYTPSEDVTLLVDTRQSDYPAFKALQDVQGNPPSGLVGVDISQCQVFSASAGQQLYFQVGGMPIGTAGTLVFNLSELPPGGTSEASLLCVEPTPTPEPIGIPPTGGPPLPEHSWPWVALLGGLLLAMASVALGVAARRSRSSSH